jgi:hypothetical protein
MKFWLASFPRSGNTFFRNILYYVYGIESSTFHKETAYPVDENYDQYFAVKTHLLPHELVPNDPKIPAVYLVRDGRDAIVSIAHQRKNLIVPDSDYYENLREAIVAAEGSFFGGWSYNVNQWLERATIVIRFEDLIKEPINCVERLREIVDLPSPKIENLPTFEDLKYGKPKYGGQFKQKDVDYQIENFAELNFRKGKIGNWQEEMSPELQDLFWLYHGQVMERLNYHVVDNSVGMNPELDYVAMKKLNRPINLTNSPKKYRILIETNKILQQGNDEIKRYIITLLKGLEEVNILGNPHWQFDLFRDGQITSLSKYRGIIQSFISDNEKTQKILEDIESQKLEPYEKVFIAIKTFFRKRLPKEIYNPIAEVYKKTPYRKIQRWYNQLISDIRNQLKRPELNRKLEAYDLIHIPLPQHFAPFTRIKNKYLVTVIKGDNCQCSLGQKKN